MKVGICTIGSTGDMQPYLALALAIRDAGHEVLVLTHPFHRSKFEAWGLPFHPCGPEVTQQQLNDLLEKMLQTRNPAKQLRLLMEEAFFAEGEAYFASAKAGLTGCDIAIVHMVDFLGAEAAAQLGMPRIGGVLTTAGIPTAYRLPPPLPNLGRTLNRLQWAIVRSMLRPVDKRAMAFLSKLGGPSVTVSGFHVLAPKLNLLACSPTLSPPPPDLPAHFEVVGPWIVPTNGFQPDTRLQEFLSRHPRPVVISLGSMGGNRAATLSATLLEAVSRTGLPAILQRGYAGLEAAHAPDNIFFADFVPHEWLFPQASCVVHHAGAGTTTAVARAGVPQVPVAFISDQPHFAQQLHRLGIGTSPLQHWQLRADRLADRILQAQSDEMQRRARDLAPVIRSETDMARTVNRIERYYREGQ